MKTPSASRLLPLLAGLILLPFATARAGGDSVEETAPPPRVAPQPRTQYYYEELPPPPPVCYYYDLPAPVVIYRREPGPYFAGPRVFYRSYRGYPHFAAVGPRFYRGGHRWHH